MEKKINKKIAEYISVFKNDIKEKAESMGKSNTEENLQLLQFIYDYERLTITKEDISKRKRQKSSVPSNERCLALRSCSEQCSRRRSVSSCFCGTHTKGVPHGSLSESVSSSVSSSMSSSGMSSSSMSSSSMSSCIDSVKKLEVSAHDVDGIMYYLDNIKNVYSPEEIHMKKHNPQKIGTYNQIGDKYQIQLFI